MPPPAPVSRVSRIDNTIEVEWNSSESVFSSYEDTIDEYSEEMRRKDKRRRGKNSAVRRDRRFHCLCGRVHCMSGIWFMVLGCFVIVFQDLTTMITELITKGTTADIPLQSVLYLASGSVMITCLLVTWYKQCMISLCLFLIIQISGLLSGVMFMAAYLYMLISSDFEMAALFEVTHRGKLDYNYLTMHIFGLIVGQLLQMWFISITLTCWKYLKYKRECERNAATKKREMKVMNLQRAQSLSNTVEKKNSLMRTRRSTSLNLSTCEQRADSLIFNL